MTLSANDTWLCPHCKVVNRFESARTIQGMDVSQLSIRIKTSFDVIKMCTCTNCSKVIIFFENNMIFPLWATRSSAPLEVPINITQDYNEACLVESLSNKAAAALARRCLQHMLHDQGIKDRDLSKEIEIAMKALPSHLSEAIDAIRNIGNFAAHPIKSTNTWDIVEVEDWETERILDVLEQLFDFYYVQPALTKSKKAQLDAKLIAAWKQPTK